MPRRKLVTADVISQIESWVNNGLSAVAIAERIGCTLGTLRVRCSQFGISLRRKGRRVAAVTDQRMPAEGPRPVRSELAEKRAATRPRTVTKRHEIDAVDQEDLLVIWMPQPAVHHLRSRAARKGISESALATILLETVVRDDLYEAVLDEGSTKANARMAAGALKIGRHSGRLEVARRRVSEPESLHSAPRAPAGPKTSETTINVQQEYF